MAAVTPEKMETEEATSTPDTMDSFLDTLAEFKTCERPFVVSSSRILQEVYTQLYYADLRKKLYVFRGSRYEGLPAEVCSDNDAMLTSLKHPVVITIPPLRSVMYKYGFVLAQSEKDRPAYLRLKVTNLDALNEEVKEVITDGGYVNSSVLVENRAMKKLQIMRRGSITPQFPSHPHHGRRDEVFCFRSASWPPVASEFLSRGRPSGWPDPALLERVRQGGCHVVPTHHPQSTGSQRDTEWRWSFSVAEREILQAASTAVAGAIYFLRAIYRKYWTDKDELSIFCPYYIKTACLWASEGRQYEETRASALMKDAIDWLISSYRGGQLPHYFIPGQNVIGHLLPETRDKVASWLEEVRANLGGSAISSVFIGPILESVLGEMKKRLEETKHEQAHDSRDLIKVVCSSEKKDDILRNATSKLNITSELYILRLRGVMGHMKGVQSVIPHVLYSRICKKTPADKVIQIPERIFQPILENMKSLTEEGYQDTFTNAIYRDIGECYHALYVYYTKVDTPSATTCYEKAVYYFSAGKEAALPSGFTDAGLSGLVLLAKLYYLDQSWERLREVMAELEPLLLVARDNTELIRSVPWIFTDVEAKLMVAVWELDVGFHDNVLAKCDEEWLFQHPVALGYYIKTMLALKDGDRAAAEGCLQDLQLIEPCLKNQALLRSSKSIMESINIKLYI